MKISKKQQKIQEKITKLLLAGIPLTALIASAGCVNNDDEHLAACMPSSTSFSSTSAGCEKENDGHPAEKTLSKREIERIINATLNNGNNEYRYPEDDPRIIGR